MAAVRMYAPPARDVKRPNQRWDRQRRSTRGHGPTDDHGGNDQPLPPEQTGLTPTSVVAGAATTNFNVTGANFVPGSVVHIKVGAAAFKVATTAVVDADSLSFEILAADLAVAATILWDVTNPDGQAVGGVPNITVTAA